MKEQWLRKLTAIVTLCAVVLTMSMTIIGCGGDASAIRRMPSFSSPDVQRAYEENEATRTEMERLIAEVEQAQIMQRQSDGTVSLRTTNSRTANISPEAMDLAQESVAALNAEVKAGRVMVQDDLSVIATGVNRANENGWRLYWWGVRYALDNTRTQRLRIIVASLGAAGGAAIGALLGGPAGAALGALLGCFPASLIEWYAIPGRGIYIYYQWARRWWITSQP